MKIIKADLVKSLNQTNLGKVNPRRGKMNGMILGKFLPPHLGHQYLIDFALNYVDRLAIVVGTISAEPIPGGFRHQWIKEMAPSAEVIHLTDENPQYPHEHPDFWDIWKRSLTRVLPFKPDYLFASEQYGIKLAKVMGAQFVPVDIARELVPISGRELLKSPMKHWKYIPPPVRPYFLKRVAIIGPESTGKSMLAKRLADHFQTAYVHEYARPMIELQDNQIEFEDITKIARGQIAAEDAMAKQASRVLICDTELITTMLWSNIFYSDCPKWVEAEAGRREYDLYLVTDIDVPWVDDPQRFLPDRRQWFRDICIEELRIRKRPFRLIGGSWDERFEAAAKAIKKLIND